MSIIKDFLESLTTDGGNGNFLIINITENIYIQFAAEKGGQTIYCEIPAANPSKNILYDANQIAIMHSLGWKEGQSDFHDFYCQTKRLDILDGLGKVEMLIHDTAAVHGIVHQLYTYDLNLE